MPLQQPPSTVRFDAARRAHCDDLCDDLIQRALERHDAFHGAESLKGWQLLRQRDALSVYRDRVQQHVEGGGGASSSSASRSSLMLCSGLIPGALDDVLAGMFGDSDESTRVVMGIRTARVFDSALVLLLEANALDAPVVFAGVKWFAVKVPGGHLIHDRDILSYERIGRIVDRRGRYFVYYAIQSIDLPEWPEGGGRHRGRRLVRAHSSVCYLLHRVNDDWVGCFMYGDFDARGHLPPAVSDFSVADTFLSFGSCLVAAYARRFSALAAAHADRALSSSKHCDRCMAMPTLLARHKHCAGCRRTVCSACRQKRTVFRLHPRTRRPERERFCRECVDEVVHRRRRRGASDDDDDGDVAAIPVLASKDDDGDARPPRWRRPASGVSLSSSASSTSSPSEPRSRDAQGSSTSEGDDADLASLARACRLESAALEWNAEELQRLSERLGSRVARKRTKDGRTHRRLDTPAELLRRTSSAAASHTVASRSRSPRSEHSSDSTPMPPLPPARARPRSTTDAIFQQHQSAQAASHTHSWTPPRSASTRGRTPSVTQVFDPLESDPEAAYESFRAAVSRARAANPPKQLSSTLVFDAGSGQYVAREPDAELALEATELSPRLKYFSIDELD